MKARYHLLTGGIASVTLFPVLGINSAVFLAASVLIDGDHYLDYLYRNGFKDFSIRRMFTFHSLLSKREKAPDFLGFNLGHTVEALLLVYAAGALTNWVWLKAVLWGMVFHLLFDLVSLFWRGRLFCRALSFIEYIIRWNLMKHKGLDPRLPYVDVLKTMSATLPPKGIRQDLNLNQ